MRSRRKRNNSIERARMPVAGAADVCGLPLTRRVRLHTKLVL